MNFISSSTNREAKVPISPCETNVLLYLGVLPVTSLGSAPILEACLLFKSIVEKRTTKAATDGILNYLLKQAQVIKILVTVVD